MHKSLIIIILANLFMINSISLFSQNSTSSPYSRYGLGELSLISNGQNRALGDISFGMCDPLHINLSNPASLSSMDTNSAYGSPFIFEYSMMNKITRMANSSGSVVINDVNLNYLAFAYPYIKNIWHGAVVLAPYSSTGYKININEDVEGVGNVDYYYYGSGGINKLAISNSFKPLKYLSIGVNANYLFGYLKQTNTLVFNDDDDAFNFQTEKNILLNKWTFDLGMQLHYSYKKNDRLHSFCLGGVYGNQAKLSGTRDIIAGTTNGSDYETISYNSIIDTIVYQTGIKGNIILPLSFGFGFTYNYDNKWLVGVDYYQQNWQNSSIFNESDSLANSNKISIGMEYTPNRSNTLNGFSNFIKRSSYRVGGYYSNTYLQFSQYNEQLKDYGISFGFGLPIRKSNSTLNIFAKIGQMGTKDHDLIQETYGIIGINLSWYDIWFVKRKYD